MTAASASTPALERRRERRVPLHLPLVVRGMDLNGENFEERTSCENVCHGGVAFATQYPLSIGIHLDILIAVAPKAAGEEPVFSTEGRIVHIKQGREQHEIIVGVEFTGARFDRI